MKFVRNSRLSSSCRPDQILSRSRSAPNRPRTPIQPSATFLSKSPIVVDIDLHLLFEDIHGYLNNVDQLQINLSTERVRLKTRTTTNWKLRTAFLSRRDGPKSENSPRAIDTGGRDDCNSCEKRESRIAYRRHSPYPELRNELRDEAKRRERARRESHSETRVSRAGGVIPRSRGPRQNTSAKPRRERGSSGFVRFRQRSALPDTPGRRSSLPTRDERPRQSARPTDASATPCRKVPFSPRSRGSSRRSECLLNHCSSRSSTK